MGLKVRNKLAGEIIVESFDVAMSKLQRFLLEHNRPSTLVWVQPEDIMTFWSRTFVRVPREVSDHHARVEFEFDQARASGHAIGLDVRGHSKERAFVVLDVATDQRDAELRMLSSEDAKLSIPETSLPEIREVVTGTSWAMLRLVAAS